MQRHPVLRKDTCEARAVLRAYPHGIELRLLYNGDLLWSRLYQSRNHADLDAHAEDARQDWRALGWRE